MEGTALRRCLEYVLDSPGREHRYPKVLAGHLAEL